LKTSSTDVSPLRAAAASKIGGGGFGAELCELMLREGGAVVADDEKNEVNSGFVVFGRRFIPLKACSVGISPSLRIGGSKVLVGGFGLLGEVLLLLIEVDVAVACDEVDSELVVGEGLSVAVGVDVDVDETDEDGGNASDDDVVNKFVGVSGRFDKVNVLVLLLSTSSRI